MFEVNVKTGGEEGGEGVEGAPARVWGSDNYYGGLVTDKNLGFVL